MRIDLSLVAVCLAVRAAAGGGPDVTVPAIPGAASWGGADGRSAFSLAADVCNSGDEVVAFDHASPAHPVVVQNMYRLADGRFEQIGMSWAVHEFCALQLQCETCTPAPSCSMLGVGCRDSSTASIMGSSVVMGARSEINATTGALTLPFTGPGGPEPEVLRGRIVVHDDDLDPALNPGAAYVVELLYIAADDAAAGNSHDNASWRAASVAAAGNYTLSLTGPVHERDPAILAWQDADPDVDLVAVDVPGDGRFIVGARVTRTEGGLYDYEYAIFNLDSHRSAGGFSIEVARGARVTSTGFHDVDYHSGEPYDGTDWAADVADGSVQWTTTPYDVDPNANALRWGTLYNVRLTTSAPPAPTTAAIHLFRPAAGPTGDVVELVLPGPTGCAADIDGSGAVDVGDALAILAAWGPCPGCPADLDGDDEVTVTDLLIVLASWGDC